MFYVDVLLQASVAGCRYGQKIVPKHLVPTTQWIGKIPLTTYHWMPDSHFLGVEGIYESEQGFRWLHVTSETFNSYAVGDSIYNNQGHLSHGNWNRD
jgi:hypothetical protein